MEAEAATVPRCPDDSASLLRPTVKSDQIITIKTDLVPIDRKIAETSRIEGAEKHGARVEAVKVGAAAVAAARTRSSRAVDEGAAWTATRSRPSQIVGRGAAGIRPRMSGK